MHATWAASILLLALSFASSSVFAHSEKRAVTGTSDSVSPSIASHADAVTTAPEKLHHGFRCHDAGTCGGSAMVSQPLVVAHAQPPAVRTVIQASQPRGINAAPPVPPPD